MLNSLGVGKTHYMGYSLGGWIDFGMAKHAPERTRSLIIGGAHAHEESVGALATVDGTDFEAFLRAVENFAGIKASPQFRDRLETNDLQALAACLGRGRASMANVLATMDVPCLLFVGERDARYDGVPDCASKIANAELLSIPDADHARALSRSELIAPRVMSFLAAAESRATG